MAIRLFVLFLLVLSLIGYFIPVEKKLKDNIEKDEPLLTFNDSTMYTLTTDGMNRVVFTQKAMRYKDRDVMHEGSLMLKSKDKDNKELTDMLFADVIVRRDDVFKFLNNVKLTRNNYLALNTDELVYNSKTKVATNTLPFDGKYFNNYLKGKDIYLDLKTNYMKAIDTHFEIEVDK